MQGRTKGLSMKYTARHIRRFLEEGRIDATLWKIHFLSLLPSQVPVCEECTKFKDRTCTGGLDPVECSLSNVPGTMTPGGPKKKKHDPMLGLGARENLKHGTVKPRDQSKM